MGSYAVPGYRGGNRRRYGSSGDDDSSDDDMGRPSGNALDPFSPDEIAAAYPRSAPIPEALHNQMTTLLAHEMITKEMETQAEQQGDICAICQCPFVVGDEVSRTPCMHRFHRNCMENALRYSGSCPVCKLNFRAHARGDNAGIGDDGEESI